MYNRHIATKNVISNQLHIGNTDMIIKKKSSGLYTWMLYRISQGKSDVLVGHVMSTSRTGIRGTGHKHYILYCPKKLTVLAGKRTLKQLIDSIS